MAFGRDLNQADSDRVRTALDDPDVASVSFFPRSTGFAKYEALEFFRRVDDSSVVLGSQTKKFKAVFAIVEEHDYPAEFNDKFFVDLLPASEVK